MEAIHKLFGDCKPITEEEANNIVNDLSSSLKELGIDFRILGSFNKKVEGSLYNDIDIAVKYPFENGSELVSKICKEKEDKTKLGKINEKFNTITISYKVKEDHDAQVDFMFCDSVEYANFVFHSPDFKKQESKYKGMYQSALMMAAISCVPPEDINKKYTVEYFSDTDYNGKYKTKDKQVKTFWKLNFDQNKGLTIHQKTWEGKTKPLANPQTVKGTEEVITKDINKIIKLCFGDKAIKEDFNSFESTIALLVSERYKYCNNNFLHRVRETFLNDWQIKMKTSPELLKELGDLLTEEINNVD